MRYKRILALLLTAALLLCAFGCAKKPGEATPTEAPAGKTPAPTESEATAEPAESQTEAPDAALIRMKNGGTLRFLPDEPIDVPKLIEMVYARPDTDSLIAGYEALTEKAASCTDANELLNDYYPIAEQRHDYDSMYSLSYFRYCLDIDDDNWADEYDFCDEQLAMVQEKQNALYAALAASPCRSELEQAYFSEGFFADYDNFNEAEERYFDLKQQENDLLFRYYDLRASAGLSAYRQIEENHDALGELFIELVKLRDEIAAAKGYDNYMDYSYACDYMRDYTTAEARGYLEQVKALLAPMMEDGRIAEDFSWYADWNESKSIDILSSAAEKMGGPILDAFRFMYDRELYDISYRSNKMDTGYTDYIEYYEAPILFVDPSGRDLLVTLVHEFGHFTDAYCNYGFSDSYEISETYSQAMQYLAFAYAEPFTDRGRAMNLRATLSDLLVYSVLREAAFADFELQVYSLEPDELTLERLDSVYGQCIADYGLSGLDSIWSNAIYWVACNHFYAYPGYVISYSDSALAAMQICRMEADEPGAGVVAFCRLLRRTHCKKFAAVLEEAGLDSPFEAATMEKTAEFLKEAFGMN